MAVIPKLATLPDNPLLPLSIQSSDWNALLEHRQAVNVLDYGADDTGVGDSTAAFEAAIAALPDIGGCVDIPAGLYAINLTINRRKIMLRGIGIGRPQSASTPGGLVPYDTTLPVLTLSDDTQLNEGICLRDLEINGRGVGEYGIKMNGGTYSGSFDNLSISNFTKKELWIRSGTSGSHPVAYLMFNKLFIQSGNFASHEHAVYLEAQTDSSGGFIAAVFFSGVRISGVGFGHVMEQSSCNGIVWTNAWFQIQSSGHGVLLSKPFDITPRLYGNGLFLDSDSGSHTLLEVSFGSGATDTTGNYVYGFVGIDGKIDLNGSLRTNQSTFHISDLALSVELKNHGKLFLVDANDQNSQGQWIQGTTSTGRLVMGTTVGEVRFQPGNGKAQIVAALASSQFDVVVTGGTHSFRGNATVTEIEPPAGGSVLLKSNTLSVGNPALNLTVSQSAGTWKFQGSILLANSTSYQSLLADGVTAKSLLFVNPSNNIFIGDGTTGGSFALVLSPGVVSFAPANVTALVVDTLFARPAIDNVMKLGDGTHRYTEVFAVNGTINTSDAREKVDVAPIDDAVLDAWADVEFVQYRWKDRVAEKGAGARVHHGLMAQHIKDAFARRGLDAHRYGLFCYDEWAATRELTHVTDQDESYEAEVVEVREEEQEVEEPFKTTIVDRRGVPVEVLALRRVRQMVKINVPVTKTLVRTVKVEHYADRPAGNRFGVRYDQCLVLEAALMRRELQRWRDAKPEPKPEKKRR